MRSVGADLHGGGHFLLVLADFDDVSKMSREPGSITPTVKLNGLEMKRGEPAISIPLDQKLAPATEQIIIFVACMIGASMVANTVLFLGYEDITVVKVGHEITIGTGPKKKIAKRNASEAMLLQLGYKASSST